MTTSDFESDESATIAAVQLFFAYFNDHDIDAVMSAMTEDCAFETAAPAPEGARYEGAEAVRAAFTEFIAASPTARYVTEEMVACGYRCFVRWVRRWEEADGSMGHVRGVDVFRVRNGKVSEKLAYVKG